MPGSGVAQWLPCHPCSVIRVPGAPMSLLSQVLRNADALDTRSWIKCPPFASRERGGALKRRTPSASRRAAKNRSPSRWRMRILGRVLNSHVYFPKKPKGMAMSSYEKHPEGGWPPHPPFQPPLPSRRLQLKSNRSTFLCSPVSAFKNQGAKVFSGVFAW